MDFIEGDVAPKGEATFVDFTRFAVDELVRWMAWSGCFFKKCAWWDRKCPITTNKCHHVMLKKSEMKE